MLDPRLLVLLHAVATLFMCGVIAMVQIVHYPLFNMVGRDQFAAYENAHTNLITLVVGPAMLLEAACVLGLLIERPGSWLAWIGAGLLGVVWFSTAFLQVPQHGILSSGLAFPYTGVVAFTGVAQCAALTSTLAISALWYVGYVS